MIAAREGKAIRFNENTVRPIGRVGAGVRGISLDEGDEVVGMICIEPNSSQDVLVLSENGYGKRTDLDEYRITNRGGKGVKTINITEKTGKLISIQAVTDENDLMIINRSGLTIRTAVDQIRVAGRATQGVPLAFFSIHFPFLSTDGPAFCCLPFCFPYYNRPLFEMEKRISYYAHIFFI